MSNKKFLFSLVTFFLVIFLTEVTLRFCYDFSEIDLKEEIFQAQLKTTHQYKAHPFFGMVFRRGQKVYNTTTKQVQYLNVNNHGFRSRIFYPPKTKDTFNIAIFGGSVADTFAVFLESSEVFKQLEDIVGKRVQILNFAIAGGKQPQQYIIQSYYEQFINLSINIDGLNEIASSLLKVPPEFPYYNLTHLINYDDVMEIFLKYKKGRQRQFYFLTLGEKTFLSSSYIYHLFLKALKMRLDRLELIINNKLNDMDEHTYKYQYANANLSEMVPHYVAVWKKYRDMQESISKLYGKQHYFFLQPIPQLEGSKKLTIDERNFVKNDFRSKENLQNILSGYKILRSLVRDYNKKNIMDFTQIFKDEPRDVYIDACCHLNDYGNRLMANKILKIIKADLNQ